MLQVWLHFISSQQYHIVFQHKPALKSTLVTSAALLWCWGISQLPPFPSCGQLQLWLPMAGHRAHLVPLSYIATTYSPLSVAWHHGRKQLHVPISLSVPTSAHSALPDLTLPTSHTLSELAHGGVKARSSSYVPSPGKISSPQGSVYFSHHLTHSFEIITLLFTADSKNLNLTAETNQGI